MTEDEAFIRAIVDGPGDDTARLVYADWLDDRDDPRGPYLRAEAKWAKPWRSGKCPAQSPVLCERAAGLDPVWVARVSRPPVGVCSDHIRFEDAQPATSGAELGAVESRLKLSLPAELRAMLLNRNGGRPEPDGYRAAWRKPTGSPDFVARFFSVSAEGPAAKRATTQDQLRKEMRDLEHTTKVLNNGFVARTTDPAAHRKWASGVREFVSLAEPAGGLGVLAIGLLGRRAGKVYALNRTLLCTSSIPRLLADSLPQFLALLVFGPEWVE
jgi:uncharacterized protein (TIGR02996 family)